VSCVVAGSGRHAICEGGEWLLAVPRAEVFLGLIDEVQVALPIDERIRRIPGGAARDELAVAAEFSRMRRDPDVGRQAPQGIEAALEGGANLGMIAQRQAERRLQVAGVDAEQDAVAVADGERP